MEEVITFSLVIGVPLIVAAIRPARAALVALLAFGLGYATLRLAMDDLHPTQLDDLAWASIVYGVMSALILVGWFAGRVVGARRTLSARSG